MDELLMTTRVAVLNDFQRRAQEFADWASLGPDVEVVFFAETMSDDEVVDRLADFDVLALMREYTPLPRHVLERLPRLKFVSTTGMNSAKTDLGYLREVGIPISGTEGGPPGARPPGPGGVVEIAFALMLALVKRTVVEDQAIREGKWQLGYPTGLGGKTLGLAGLGGLGARMVAPARAFGMDVIAWSPHLTAERAEQHGVRAVSKDSLLEASDILSIHLVLAEGTRGLFSSAEFAAMKPTALLINTSRGPIVDEAALVAALREGLIAGAGLDVYDREPIGKSHPLAHLANTVLAPHFGYVSEEYMRIAYPQVVENIAGFLSGSLVRTEVAQYTGSSNRRP